ncbi:LRRNT 2 domain-containing protein [Abeliophyllum distichum]|uniref:LRRNT 2 domain-containing protein n=1 Tax=Abeliophyllum distichum TaxID=126358 RepID=A0ABD1RQY0_9LAMI
MGLGGTIAKEVGGLSFLRSLVISNNNLRGFIPDQMGKLSQLREIEMHYNELNSIIPTSLGFFENLQKLNLSHNMLIGEIPHTILNLSSLVEISFGNNSLSGSLPTDICYSLPKLEMLRISGNQISGNIPRSLGRCLNLKLLSLSYNNFAGSIPMEIGNLSKLQILYLGGNNLIETPVDISIVEEHPCSVDKEKAPVTFESQPQVDILPNLPREVPLSSKISDEDVDSVLRSIQALFTSWEQVQTSYVPRVSSTTRPSTFSIPSTEDMDALKKVVLAYTSFMDKDISRVNADSQAELLVRLSEDLAATLKCPTLELSALARLNLRGIHQESKLNELSSEVTVKDSLLISLESEMKKLQAKIDDCKIRLAAKKHNTSLEIERTKAMMARYSELVMDDSDAVIESLATIVVDTRQCSNWSKLREQMRSVLEELNQ